MKQGSWLRGIVVAAVAVLSIATFAGLGCGASGGLANGIAPCTTDTDCPSDYHCASDLTCFRNGSDPVSDASTDACSGTPCSGACVDTASDRGNCGSCGKACAAGEVCSQGQCALSCGGGTSLCSGGCHDTTSDPKNCGACGKVCEAGLVCSQGACALACAGGATNCSGACVNTKADIANCGACGKKCGSGSTCNAGVCTTTCGGGDSLCAASAGGMDAGADGGAPYCANLAADRNNCGTCGLKCTTGLVCSASTCQVSCQANLVQCATACIDPLSSRLFCGATSGCGEGGIGSAGSACPSGQVCASGTCQVSCPNAQTNCGGSCIDPLTSRTHCGATAGCGAPGGSAGTTCAAGNVCSNGTCKVSCPGTQIECGGTCIDPRTSLPNCGATAGCGVAGGSAGTPCAAGTVCGDGICSVSCPGLQINCGGVCIDPFTSRPNCGATGACGVGPGGGSAGMSCAAGNVCANGVCAVSCPGLQLNCGGTCVDPQTSPKNCGATAGCGAPGGSAGATCKNGNVCSNGSCQVSCPGSQINCGGTCVDPQTSRSNCGATADCSVAGGTAGMACTDGNVCSGGTCQVSCPGSQINCGGVCIDRLTSPTNCGATAGCGGPLGGSKGMACGAGTVCTAGSCLASCSAPLIACSGSCVDPRFDPGHCGSCAPCPAVANATNFCASSVCGIASCDPGFANCDGAAATGCESVTDSDPNNCGGCGNRCMGGTPVCSGGACIPTPTVCGTAGEGGTTTVTCPAGLVLRTVSFASYGTPNGACGGFSIGGCHATNSTTIVAKQCIGQSSCSVPALNGVFGDPCGGTPKRLYIQATCGAALVNPVTAGMVAHYDARVGSSLVLSGNAVTQWQDLSGGGRTLINNGALPAYNPALINGVPGVDFSGGAGMISSAFPLSTSVTVFFVAHWRSPGTWGSLGHHGNRDGDWAMEQNGLSGNPNAVHWQTNNDNAGVQLNVSANTSWIFAGRMDPVTGRYFSATSTGTGVLSTTAAPPHSITAGNKILYIGKSDVNEASNAYIGQIIYYNRSLSDAERNSVIAYLRSSWGI